MEATFNWPWVADLAEKCGLRPHLGDPMRIKDFRKGLPKTVLSNGMLQTR